ncbi:uncharacterized protein JCM15063_005961 [Sporobolomyces koalae]|uniref:uncharacterized protein n=1 Tax=Sporobolomyces koalae TaxID=500713 RepID=UPI003179557A
MALPIPPPPPLSILDSLHASRQSLLKSALPPFNPANQPQLQHPPHVLTHFSTTTVTIGPHSFPRTKFYLVEWTTPHFPHASRPIPPTPPPPPAKPTPAAPQAITPSLIQRLNAASLTDPALAALLRRAATGQATPDELNGLSKKIEQLRKEEELEQNPPPPTEPVQPQGPPADVPHPALLIEFSESAPERFLVPDHYLCVTLTPRAAPQVPVTTVALLLSFFVFPLDRVIRGREHDIIARGGTLPAPPPVPIDMIVEGVKEVERDQFMRASRLGRPRDAGLENWWKNTMGAVPARVHVIHQPRLPPPPLPTDMLQAPSLSRTNSEATTTVPLKRGASGTPVSNAAAGANKRGKSVSVVTAAEVSGASRGSRTNYRESPEPSPPPRSVSPDSPNTIAQRALNPIRKKPGPKPGWKKAAAAAAGQSGAATPTGGGRGGGGKRKKKSKAVASSDEDDWTGIKVIE